MNLILKDKNEIRVYGFVENHNHSGTYPILDLIDLIDITKIETKEELIEKLEEFKNRKIIVAYGLNTDKITKLTKNDLDKISNSPIIIVDPSFHGGYFNSKTVEIIESKNPVNMKGEINKDGKWSEDYIYLWLDLAVNVFSKEELTKKILEWVIDQVKKGVCQIHDLDVATPTILECILDARRIWTKRLGVEFPIVRFYGNYKVHLNLDKNLKSRIKNEIGSLGLKLFSDGSLGSFTACMQEPYENTKNKGIIFQTIEDFKKLLEDVDLELVENLAIHAIGDSGVLNSLKLIEIMNEKKKVISRIEHFEVVDENILKKTKRLVEDGLIEAVSLQPPFNDDIKNYSKRLGQRTQRINRIKDLIELEIPIVFGTDGNSSGYPPPSMIKAVEDSIYHPNKDQRIDFETAIKISCSKKPFIKIKKIEVVGNCFVYLDSKILEKREDAIGTLELESMIKRVIYKGKNPEELEKQLFN